MTNQTSCSECGAEILRSTAESTGGLCMPCKKGYRKNIEESKQYYAKRKQYDPFRALWISLVKRVDEKDQGYSLLTSNERIYYAVCLLDGEVYNGGMHQFFWNTSGAHYQDAVAGLVTLDAMESLRLLLQAKTILFEAVEPPIDRKARWDCMKHYPEHTTTENPEWCDQLQNIDKEYCKNPDGLDTRLTSFAEATGLVEPFRLPSE